MAVIEHMREIVGGDSDSLAELERLYAEHGDGLTPDVVLDAAREETSALHRHFEWDDSVAAESWRKHQARELIQSYKLHIIDGGGERMIRYYANVVVEDQHVYKRTEDVIRVDALREQRRMKLLRELNRVRDELETFEEFSIALSAVRDAIASLEKRE